MKISIVVPIYNATKTLGKCLNSLINQTYKDLEIILINDGSTDNSYAICNEFKNKDNRVKLINQENKGVSYTRNKGIEISTGDYITFVDSDDYLELNCFEIIAKQLDNNLDFIRYNFNTIGKKQFNDNLYELKNKTINIKKDFNNLMTHFLTFREPIPNLTQLLLIKSNICKCLRFNEKLTMMEDVDFYNQLFFKATIGKFIDNKLYNYYNNPDSTTHNKKNFSKIIYGIMDTNKSLNDRCKHLDKKIIQEMNSNHVRIISNYLIDMYIVDKKKFKQELEELKNNSYFNYLINVSNKDSMPKKNKMLLRLMSKPYLLKLYLMFVVAVYKCKGKI